MAHSTLSGAMLYWVLILLIYAYVLLLSFCNVAWFLPEQASLSIARRLDWSFWRMCIYVFAFVLTRAQIVFELCLRSPSAFWQRPALKLPVRSVAKLSRSEALLVQMYLFSPITLNYIALQLGIIFKGRLMVFLIASLCSSFCSTFYEIFYTLCSALVNVKSRISRTFFRYIGEQSHFVFWVVIWIWTCLWIHYLLKYTVRWW